MRNRTLIAVLVFACAATTNIAVGSAWQAPVGVPPQPSPDDVARRRVAEDAAARVAQLNDKTPLQVQVVVSRYSGDKKIGSLPYVLTVNAGASSLRLEQSENSRLRMGSDVPVPSSVFTPVASEKAADGSAQPAPLRSFTYRSVGTNIDCRARSMGDGRFELGISIEDNSIIPDGGSPGGQQAAPSVRSFQSSQTLILRDGQSRQFTAATDRVSGEVVRIDVTLTVVK